MKKIINIIALTVLSIFNSYGQVNSWKSTLDSLNGNVVINYYNSDNFISDASGELRGIEYDLLEDFFKYCESYYGIKINREYKKSESFGALYLNIKDSAKSGEFAACSFSMTEQRLKEVGFSPKYIPDIEVMICSQNVPIVSDSVEFVRTFKNLTALTIPNSTFDQDIRQIQTIIPDLNVVEEKYAIDVRNRIASEDNLFSYIELPNYILALKNGINLKRQYLFKVERQGYGFIYPKNSDWEIPVNEYFKSNQFKETINSILIRSLGNDVKELVNDLGKIDKVMNEKELALLNKEREIQSLEIEKQNIQIEKERNFRYILIFGVLFVLLVTGLLFKQNEVNKRKNILLETQKNIIEDKNKDITDGINYAKRIQKAALISKEDRLALLPNSFIIYKPKETLSGDFFWCGKTYSDEKGKIKIAAVGDCTGHGVPGALLSILGINYLNIASRSPDINNCGQALSLVNQGIKETFETSVQNTIADGMDAAIIAINDQTLDMDYAAAINPIFIVRNEELIVLKGDKFPIGKNDYSDNKEFTSHSFQLEKGDSIFLFSDGYADQFGGENDKKIGVKKFKALILETNNLPIEEQQKTLSNFFEDWKKDEEQTDDVCVFGIRV